MTEPNLPMQAESPSPKVTWLPGVREAWESERWDSCWKLRHRQITRAEDFVLGACSPSLRRNSPLLFRWANKGLELLGDSPKYTASPHLGHVGSKAECINPTHPRPLPTVPHLQVKFMSPEEKWRFYVLRRQQLDQTSVVELPKQSQGEQGRRGRRSPGLNFSKWASATSLISCNL